MMQEPVSESSAETHAQICSPWRRFFARSLDLYIHTVLWYAFLSVVMNVNIVSRSTGQTVLDTFVVSLTLMIIEPAMLSLFGTTVGKWVLGLGVTDNKGRRLSYAAALSRTWTVFLRGMGLNIPIYHLVRHWKSYCACKDGKTLDWEYDSNLTLRDTKGWRIGVFVTVYALVFGMLLLTTLVAEMPRNRGEITVTQFCENYNHFSDYFGIDNGGILDEKGNWIKPEDTSYVMYIGGEYDEPEYMFDEMNGIMTGMHFSLELHNSDMWVPSYQDEMILSILSFVRAQKGSGPFSNDVNDIIKQISEIPFGNYQYTINGIFITCDVAYSGYMDTGSIGFLYPEEGAETNYTIHFSMVKI